MLRLLKQAERAAQADATVLITGESGVGKELIAEAVHKSSPRARGPFVAVNMAAVPETLMESELFGHVAGSFTGATANRAGRFQSADGGTLFIDEIGDLVLPSQAKLLRVLENRQVTPVGSNEVRPVNTRVIAATNRDLEQMVATGQFREDLYYRLNVVSVAIPPLRERPGDVRMLVEHFLEELCRANHRPLLAIHPELMTFLETYAWPGNVRQLRNCMESMVVLAQSETLTLDDLPAMVRRRKTESRLRLEIPHGFTLEDVEQAAIRQRLDRFSGNRTLAARSLGISVRTLQRRLKSWQGGDPEDDDLIGDEDYSEEQEPLLSGV